MTRTFVLRAVVALSVSSWLVAAPHAGRFCDSLTQQPANAPSAPEAAQELVAVNAWGVLIQSIRTIEKYLTAGELSGVHSEDSALVMAVSALLDDPVAVRPEARDQLQLTLVRFGRKVADLHAAADLFDQPKVDALRKEVLAASETLMSYYGEDTLRPARLLAERYTCPMHADIRGRSTDTCPKCGMELDQPVRIPLYSSGGSLATKTVSAEIRTSGPLRTDQSVNGILKLTTVGRPLLITDLRVVHTERIHLLVIDPSLTDYHHIHPSPSGTPGEYAFSFRPRKAGSYRAWADVRTTATGFQEYAMADIGPRTTDEPPADPIVRLRSEADGLVFELVPDAPRLTVGQAMRVRLRVSDASGKPFTELEPLMGTFAHLVGFADDYRTVIHTHPKTAGPLKAEQRGGPELEFQLYATQAGFYRLFAQVQVKGVSRYAPFGVRVAPAER